MVAGEGVGRMTAGHIGSRKGWREWCLSGGQLSR